MSEVAFSILMFISGLIWGAYFAERRSSRRIQNDDAGTRLISIMATKLLEGRKFAGRACGIETVQKFKINDDEFVLTLALESDAERVEP